MANAEALISAERITRVILVLRGHRVLLDAELAALYGVTTKVFNQAVKRNLDRFPKDFSFQLSMAEANALRSRIVTLKRGRGQHRKYLPYAFTEHGAITREEGLVSLTDRENDELQRNKIRDATLHL